MVSYMHLKEKRVVHLWIKAKKSVKHMKNENIMIKLLYIYNIYVQQILQYEERMQQLCNISY